MSKDGKRTSITFIINLNHFCYLVIIRTHRDNHRLNNLSFITQEKKCPCTTSSVLNKKRVKFASYPCMKSANGLTPRLYITFSVSTNRCKITNYKRRIYFPFRIF